MSYVVHLYENGDNEGSGDPVKFECVSYRFEAGWAIFENAQGITAVQNHYVTIEPAAKED